MKNDDPAANGRQPAEQKQPHGAAPPNHAGHHSDPGDKRQQTHERAYWLVTGAASVVATIATVVAAGFAIGAYKASWQAVRAAEDQALIAKSTLIASNRPWIKVTGLENTKVEVRDDSVVVATNIGVKNVGSSPAPRTFIRTKLLPEGSIIDDGREAETICGEAVANGFPPFEALVFPNETHGFFEVAVVDMKAINKSRADEIQKTYEINKPIFGEKFAQAHKAEMEAVPLRASFTLIGCAVYNIPVGQFAGQTAFVYGFNYNCGEGPFGLCTFDMIKPAMYMGQDVKVREPVGGTFAR